MKKVKDGIMGVVIGDALGVPYEFKPRKYFDENPVNSMDGYGTHNQPAGTWSDDSSLTLATLDSLTNGIDYEDMMKKFYAWFMDSDYTATGEIFDMGITTRTAIIDYGNGKNPIMCGGNGELVTKNFESDRSVKKCVVGQIHDPARPGSEDLNQPIFPEASFEKRFGARRRLHRGPVLNRGTRRYSFIYP